MNEYRTIHKGVWRGEKIGEIPISELGIGFSPSSLVLGMIKRWDRQQRKFIIKSKFGRRRQENWKGKIFMVQFLQLSHELGNPLFLKPLKKVELMNA